MIIVKVIGGLGNQMFQIAYARSISLELGEDIYLDTSSYKRYKIRNFSIHHLKISESLKYIEHAKIPIHKKILLKMSQISYRAYQKLVKEFSSIDKFGEKAFKLLSKKGLYYNFDRYYYEINLDTYNDIRCIYGYFQSEKYFNKYKDHIKKEFKVKTPPTLKEKNLLDEIKSCNAVGVSIRLGDDYLKSRSLNVCTEEYYYEGMDYIYKQNKDVVFYIFSDSIEQVKEKFKFKYPVRYIEGFKDYESLRLLYSCKHFVIANSSFSWWGAYLSDNQNKIIIAPNKWYNDVKNKPDIYTDNMTLIEV